MKLSVHLLTLAIAFAVTTAMVLAADSFYDLKTKTLLGKDGNLAQYKGKVSLVVNVASKCGFTPQYEGLEKLQREMKGKPFNVLGFPSNDFGQQEPGPRGSPHRPQAPTAGIGSALPPLWAANTDSRRSRSWP